MKVPPSWKLRQFAEYAAVLVGEFVERKPRTRVHRCALASANNALKLDLTRPHHEAFGVNCEILIAEPDIFSSYPLKLIATRHSIAQANTSRDRNVSERAEVCEPDAVVARCRHDCERVVSQNESHGWRTYENLQLEFSKCLRHEASVLPNAP